MSEKFLESEIAQQLGDQGHVVAEQVSSGGLGSESTQQIPAEMLQHITAAAMDASTDGLHYAMTLAAIVAVVGAVLGFTLIRKKDLFQELV